MILKRIIGIWLILNKYYKYCPVIGNLSIILTDNRLSRYYILFHAKGGVLSNVWFLGYHISEYAWTLFENLLFKATYNCMHLLVCLIWFLFCSIKEGTCWFHYRRLLSMLDLYRWFYVKYDQSIIFTCRAIGNYRSFVIQL